MDNSAAWELALQKIDEVNENVVTLSSDVAVIKSRLDLVDKHERALRGGNGDGIGLIAEVRHLARMVEEHHILIIGEKNEPGLKGEVAQLTKRSDSQSDNWAKFIWIVVGSLVGTAISIIATLTVLH